MDLALPLVDMHSISALYLVDKLFVSKKMQRIKVPA